MPNSTRTKSFCSVQKIVVFIIFPSLFFTCFSYSLSLKKTKVLTNCEAMNIDAKYFVHRQKWLGSSYLKISIQILLPNDSVYITDLIFQRRQVEHIMLSVCAPIFHHVFPPPLHPLFCSLDIVPPPPGLRPYFYLHTLFFFFFRYHISLNFTYPLIC